MNTEDLVTFVRIAETGSVTKAAELLDRPQPVLSRRIASLERQCGGHLFQRTGRGVVLTALGERVLARARVILREADQIALEGMQRGPGAVRGEVTVGLIPSLGRTISQALFARTRKEHPDIFLRVFEMFSGELSASLDKGGLDLALMLRGGTTLQHEEASFATWITHLVGPPGDPVTARGEIAFRELEGLPLILSSSPSGARLQIDELAKQHRIRLDVIAEVNSAPITLQLLSMGLGYSLSPLGPLSLMSMELLEGRVQSARLVDPEITRTLILRQGAKRSAAIAAVAATLSVVVQDLKAGTPLHAAGESTAR